MKNYKVVGDYLHLCGYEFTTGEYFYTQEDDELMDNWIRAFDPLKKGDACIGIVRQQYIDELIKRHEIRLETQ